MVTWYIRNLQFCRNKDVVTSKCVREIHHDITTYYLCEVPNPKRSNNVVWKGILWRPVVLWEISSTVYGDGDVSLISRIFTDYRHSSRCIFFRDSVTVVFVQFLVTDVNNETNGVIINQDIYPNDPGQKSSIRQNPVKTQQ